MLLRLLVFSVSYVTLSEELKRRETPQFFYAIRQPRDAHTVTVKIQILTLSNLMDAQSFDSVAIWGIGRGNGAKKSEYPNASVRHLVLQGNEGEEVRRKSRSDYWMPKS